MKKKLLTFCLIFIFMFIININDVKGITTCEYGIKESDDDTWEHKITLEMYNYDTFTFNVKSPIYKKFESKYGTANVPAHGNAIYRYQNQSTQEDYYIYVKFYIDEDSFNEAGKKCPEYINYKFTESEDTKSVKVPIIGTELFEHQTSDNTYYHLALYTDDLLLKKIKYGDGDNSCDGGDTSSSSAAAYGFSKTKGIMISKEAKDKNLNEIFDVYGCNTYSSYYKAMSQAKLENGGSCDGSKEFKEKYNDIQELCTAYRSSSDYVGDDGKVPECQKACTALEDDVAELCTITDPDVDCGSLSGTIVTYIFKLFGFARYIVPVILIILSIIDYIKAIASDSEDEMKKVSGRFAKRLLAAALIFIIPLIIDFILGIFNIPGLNADRPFCE